MYICGSKNCEVKKCPGIDCANEAGKFLGLFEVFKSTLNRDSESSSEHTCLQDTPRKSRNIHNNSVRDQVGVDEQRSCPFFYNFHSIFYTGLGLLRTKYEKYGDSEKLVSDNGKVGQKGC